MLYGGIRHRALSSYRNLKKIFRVGIEFVNIRGVKRQTVPLGHDKTGAGTTSCQAFYSYYQYPISYKESIFSAIDCSHQGQLIEVAG